MGQDNARRNAHLQAQCVQLVPGDPVTLYLKRRGLGGVWPLPGAATAWWLLPYWQDSRQVGAFPAMVAAVTAPDGRTVALHRTYLTQRGRRPRCPPSRRS